MVVWLVMRMSNPIEILGLCSTQGAAIERCSQPHDVIGPLEVDAPIPDAPTQWPGAFYPLAPLSESAKRERPLLC